MISIIIYAFSTRDDLPELINSFAIQHNVRECFEIYIVYDSDFSDKRPLIPSDGYSEIDLKWIDIKDKGSRIGGMNAALHYASGEYVCFLKEQDNVGSRYLSSLISKIEEGYDLIIPAHTRMPSKSDYVRGRNFDGFMSSNSLKYLVWGSMFRKGVIDEHSLHFHQSMEYGYDLCFTFEYMSVCDSMTIISGSRYHSGFSDQLPLRTYSVEYSEFKKIKAILEAFVKDKLIRTVSGIEAVLTVKAYALSRLIDAVYYDSSLSSKKRISILKSFDDELLPYVEHACGLSPGILDYLLSHKLFFLYDIVRSVAG